MEPYFVSVKYRTTNALPTHEILVTSEINFLGTPAKPRVKSALCRQLVNHVLISNASQGQSRCEKVCNGHNYSAHRPHLFFGQKRRNWMPIPLQVPRTNRTAIIVAAPSGPRGRTSRRRAGKCRKRGGRFD